MSFVNADVAARLLTPPMDWLEYIESLKTFKVKMDGPDELTYWFAQTLMKIYSGGWKFGLDLPDNVFDEVRG